jgi:hypothetical protein
MVKVAIRANIYGKNSLGTKFRITVQMKAKKGDVPLMGGYIGCKPSCRPSFLFQYQLLLKIKVKRAKSHSFLQTGKIQNCPFKI